MPDPAPLNVFLALYTRTPESENDPGEEVAYGSYARVRIQHLQAQQDLGFTNETEISFPQATADWGTVRGFGVFNGQGELLVAGSIQSHVHVTSGTTVTFPRGALRLVDIVARDVANRILNPPPRDPGKTIWERLDDED